MSEGIGKITTVAFLAATVLSACRGAADNRTAPAVESEPVADVAATRVDACTLVTRDEAQAVLGAIMGEPSRYIDRSKSMCTFVVAEGDTTIRVDYPIAGDGAAATAREDDGGESSIPSGKPHFVSASGYLLSVESTSPAMASALAAKAAGRLP